MTDAGAAVPAASRSSGSGDAAASASPVRDSAVLWAEALQALARGHLPLEHLVPGYYPLGATPHHRARATVYAVTVLGARLRRAA